MAERSRAGVVRCAIYTRKSTDEGLEQDFNSLDAQREACAAYVTSQRHEGWRMYPERYDDGGISGGTLDRPGLQRLLAAIDAGEVSMVVVYKIDRLTRSLADFAKLVEHFDAAGCSFVSVTQSFNTSTSMGRLTLNVLLSFAQFEREVTAERIRDKIAASKRRGMWMGGTAPVGYWAVDRKLIVVPDEAALVRRIFERYLSVGSVHRLCAELDAAGIRTPVRSHRTGRQIGGGRFSRGQLYAILANPIYAGRIPHKGTSHPGQQEPIVDEALWQSVQEKLAVNRRAAMSGIRGISPSPLAGRLLDPDGRPMRPSHANKRGRRYRYYVSADLVERSVATGARGWRIPADEIELALARVIAARFSEPGFRSGIISDGDLPPEDVDAAVGRLADLANELSAGSRASRAALLRALVRRTQLSETSLVAEIGLEGLHSSACPDPRDRLFASLPTDKVTVPIRLARRGVELRIVLQGAAATEVRPDPALVSMLIRARSLLADYLDPARSCTLGELAEWAGIDAGDLTRLLQVAFLAPDTTERILDGTQPPSLTAQRLKRLGELPLCWDEQRQLLSSA